MKSDSLLDAIGLISDEYVQDAKSVRKVRRNYAWLKWGAMAACVCILITVSFRFSIFNSGDTTASNSATGGSSHAGSSSNSGSSEQGWNEGGDGSDSNGCSIYPYNDLEVLDYVGAELANIETDDGTIIFHEITDIELYRALNKQSKSAEEPCYRTHDGIYHYMMDGLVREENTQDFVLFADDGALEGSRDYALYQQVCERYPTLEPLVDYFIENDEAADSLSGVAVYDWEAVAIRTILTECQNGLITVLLGKDLDRIDERVADFVSPMRAMLGTDESSIVAGQEVAVQYFYQQRTFRTEEIEECYNYYVYFEKGDMQYLYQFSSNWTLPGEGVTAVHHPPDTLSYAMTQEDARRYFVDILAGIIASLE